ncbi:MAG: hypothetical protein AAF543_24360, partial [Pseudomonadota bacterium]
LLEPPGGELTPEAEQVLDSLDKLRAMNVELLDEAKLVFEGVFSDSPGEYYSEAIADQIVTLDMTIDEVKDTNNRGRT